MLDLELAARQLSKLVEGISADQLSAPTPCADWTVAAVLDHVLTSAAAFTAARTKSESPGSPPGDAANLPSDWLPRLQRQLPALVEAWRSPDAWQGTTEAAGVVMPAELMGAVILEEMVVHGWDIARATGQSFTLDPASAEACLELTSTMAEPGREAEREGMFGPVFPVPEGAPVLDRIVGNTGRQPNWPS